MVGASSNIVAWPAHVALCKLSPASTLVCPSLLEKHQQNCGSELSSLLLRRPLEKSGRGDEARSSFDKSALENVQKFVGRVITGKWYPILLEELNWLPLTTRQKMQYRWTTVHTYLPFFQPSSSPCFHHSKPFNTIKSSFFIPYSG